MEIKIVKGNKKGSSQFKNYELLCNSKDFSLLQMSGDGKIIMQNYNHNLGEILKTSHKLKSFLTIIIACHMYIDVYGISTCDLEV